MRERLRLARELHDTLAHSMMAMLTEIRGRATAADLPVLVLTADTTREATHRALRLGANDFLTKPLDAVEASALGSGMSCLSEGDR